MSAGEADDEDLEYEIPVGLACRDLAYLGHAVTAVWYESAGP
jgi:hypothetical protein